ncbi:DUF4403 family protein [Spirosoma taeanense]|nr:DUF4403 family protein [Spirosoma taeanense]
MLLLIQCKKIDSEAPKAEGFDPPIAPTPSYLAGTLTFPLSELQAKINETLDPVLVGKKSQKGLRVSFFPFSVIRSGPVEIQYSNQQIQFSAPLQVQLRRPLSSKKDTISDSPFCELQVNFMSPLTLTSEWRMKSHVHFDNYKWITKPKLNILGIKISLVNFAQKILDKHQTDIETAIDTAIYKELRLDELVRPIWRDLQKPLRIDKQYGLWLIPKPVRVAASPISGDNTHITTPLLITFNTETKLSPEEPDYPVTPLPRLEKREQIPEQADLHLLSSIPYADINRMLDRTLQNKQIKVALGTLHVNKASVYGAQNSIIVKTEVSGLIDGTLYLRGRPMFDTTTNTLRVSNLGFVKQTEESLPKTVGTDWHEGLSSLLEGLLKISLGDDFAQLPQKIDKAFEGSKAGKKTDLGIRTFRFVPQKIAVRPDGLQVLIKVESKIAVQVKNL